MQSPYVTMFGQLEDHYCKGCIETGFELKHSPCHSNIGAFIDKQMSYAKREELTMLVKNIPKNRASTTA